GAVEAVHTNRGAPPHNFPRRAVCVELIGEDPSAGLICTFDEQRAGVPGVDVKIAECCTTWAFEAQHNTAVRASPAQARAGFARAVADELHVAVSRDVERS